MFDKLFGKKRCEFEWKYKSTDVLVSTQTIEEEINDVFAREFIDAIFKIYIKSMDLYKELRTNLSKLLSVYDIEYIIYHNIEGSYGKVSFKFKSDPWMYKVDNNTSGGLELYFAPNETRNEPPPPKEVVAMNKNKIKSFIENREQLYKKKWEELSNYISVLRFITRYADKDSSEKILIKYKNTQFGIRINSTIDIRPLMPRHKIEIVFFDQTCGPVRF